MEIISGLIDGRIPVTLLRQGKRPLQSRVIAFYSYRHIPYLLLARPLELRSAYQIQDLLFKIRGMPILGFSCPVTRESDTILATMMPQSLFSLELRQGTRIETPLGSTATFFLRGRSQVNTSVMENISLGGVKLSGQLAHALGPRDLVGPCTLSLAGKDAVISREVTINNAVISRIEKSVKHQVFGVKFELTSVEEQQLREHLEFLGKLKLR